MILFLSLGWLGGCTSIPKGRAAVETIDFRGNEELSDSDIEGSLATRETSRFLGLVQGIFFDYRIFDQTVLQSDLQRVERIYRARGFYQARVRASRVFYVEPDHVRVWIDIEEGPPTALEKLEITGIEKLPAAEKRILELVVAPYVGKGIRFEEAQFEKAEEALSYELRSLGYAYARVERSAEVDLPTHTAHARLSVTPHEKARYGEIRIVGLGPDIPEKKVRRTLDLTPGEPYSERELDDARQATLSLGVFSSVRVLPQLQETPPANPVVPLVVEVEPTKLRTIELGAGSQLDVIRFDLHGSVGWRNQNFFGGLRELRVLVKPGIVLYPTRLQALDVAPTDILPFVKVQGDLKQPGMIEARTNAFIRGEFEAYPLLLSPNINQAAPVLGYREVRGTVGLERAFGRHLYASPSYIIQTSSPFTYRGDLDPDLHPLLISTIELFGRIDTRDNILQPHSGFTFSTGLQFSGLGGDVADVRISPEVRGYFPLAKKWTLAARLGTGFLFPGNWGATLEDGGSLPPAGTDRATWVRDTQISLFRSFFAGGPNSNRGYGLRGIGPHGVIPFFVPGIQGPDAASNCETDPNDDPETCLLPLGGRTLWEASLELRFPIVDPLSGALFCDAADVAPQAVTFRFDRLHLSCGFGARYGTPVGPVRFDVGYRIPGMQTLGDDRGEGVPPDFFGVPLGLALSIGEAF